MYNFDVEIECSQLLLLSIFTSILSGPAGAVEYTYSISAVG